MRTTGLSSLFMRKESNHGTPIGLPLKQTPWARRGTGHAGPATGAQMLPEHLLPESSYIASLLAWDKVPRGRTGLVLLLNC